MKVVEAGWITEKVRELVLEASVVLPPGVIASLEAAKECERLPLARDAISDILENAKVAKAERAPLCQDCGVAIVFMDVGQDVRIVGGDAGGAIDEGVRQAYDRGYLRRSVCADPLFDRVNTKDNTPAVVHWRIVPGSRIDIRVAPKGMGAENMSCLAMLKPSDGVEGVLDFVVRTIAQAGPNACPPLVVGVGVGGVFETAPLAAKRALVRGDGTRNPDPRYAELELEIVRRGNLTGIGAGGYGGTQTILDARVEWLATHIGGLPVAVNLCCHALRHAAGYIEGRDDA